MNLGTQFQAAQKVQVEAAQRAERERQALAAEQELKVTLGVRFFFDYAFEIFEHRLSNGLMPESILLGKDTFRDVAHALGTSRWKIPVGREDEWRTAGSGIWNADHPQFTLWQAFDERCKAVGLAPHWKSSHDGMGRESWFELTVTAAS